MTDQAVAQALGDLQGTVRAMAEQWRRQEETAVAGRHELRDKVDELKEAQSRTANQISQLTSEFSEIKPAVKRFEAERQREAGARSLGKLIWSGITAFAMGLGYLINEWLHLFWPPKH